MGSGGRGVPLILFQEEVPVIDGKNWESSIKKILPRTFSLVSSLISLILSLILTAHDNHHLDDKDCYLNKMFHNVHLVEIYSMWVRL